jgi:2-dehydro-3-deoxy-L-rhamnonate dehydrogenase (NAD+)
MDFLDLTNRVAIVTGAAQGIGLAVAQRLVSAGASVAVVDVNAKDAEKAAKEMSTDNARAKAFACDVADWDSVQQMYAAVATTYGPIDILVNNAGVGGEFAPIQDQTIEEWHRVITVDLTGVFYCCRGVIPQMIHRGYGRIINVASLAGKNGSPLMVPYSAAKAGVIGLTKALAKEVAQNDVLVNVITPAIIETPLLSDEMPVETAERLLQQTPAGRFGRPEEVAAMVHWLTSEDISYTTGAVFDLSGGRATY